MKNETKGVGGRPNDRGGKKITPKLKKTPKPKKQNYEKS